MNTQGFMETCAMWSLGVFILGAFAVFSVFAARYFVRLPSVAVELGIGRALFSIMLNRYRYQINFAPFIMCNLEAPRMSNRQSWIISLSALAGFFSLACVFIGAAFMCASPEMNTSSPSPIDAISEPYALIRRVDAGSPAMAIGLTPGMSIVKVNGRGITTSAQLVNEYRHEANTLELEGFNVAGDAMAISLPVTKKPRGGLEPIGFAYQAMSEPQHSDVKGGRVSVLRFAQVMAQEGGRSWWDRRSIPTSSIELRDHQPASLKLLLWGAIFSLIMIFSPLLNVLDRRAWPVLVVALTLVQPGSVVAALFYLVCFAVFRKSNHLPMLALWFFMLSHAMPLANGLLRGLMLEIASVKSLAVWWTL